MSTFRFFLVIAVLGVLFGCSGSDDSAAEEVTTTTSETTTTELTTTTTAAPTTTLPSTTVAGFSEAEAREIVDSAFAAFNSGDMDTWALWREGGWVTGEYFEQELAAGSSFNVEECTYRGYAEWQMDGPMTGHGFDCAVTLTDLFLDAAGIELEMIYNWVIGSDPESSLAASNENFRVAGDLMSAFREWLAASYPEVEASIRYDGDYPTAGSVQTALEYVDEFVAQSSEYPLTEPVPAANYGGPLD